MTTLPGDSGSGKPGPAERAGAVPTRREVIALGGGFGLAALLVACGDSVPPAEPAPAGTVRITTTGTTFSPVVELAAGSTATVSWAVEGGATVTGANPTMSFPAAAARRVRMTVRDGGADALDQVVTFNLGFDHRDDAGIYNLGVRHDRAAQAVTLVEGISRLSGLRRFAAAHTTLAGSLDFTGCSRLQFIECIGSDIQSVNLTGCTSLIRLVVEKANLKTLDLNPVAATLRDLRGAVQQSGTLTLTPLRAPLAALYHFCVRDQSVVNYPAPARLPVVEERWDWNTGRSGALTSASSALRSLSTSGNRYTTADLTGQFPAGRSANLDASSNDLRSVNLSGCSGLADINLRKNRLDAAAVDGVLALVASWGTSGGILNLSGNSRPSAGGAASGATLAGRGWTVTLDT